MCSGNGTPGRSTSSSGKMGNCEFTTTASPCTRFYAIREFPVPGSPRNHCDAMRLPLRTENPRPLTCFSPRDRSVGMEMDGKVVVVTGASMGIGEAIAQVFVDAGARVVLLSRDAGRAGAARPTGCHGLRCLPARRD